ncbi:MAG: S9 family peptidase [Pseudomonadota bacterium]|jgi:dipeptidyl aminopeptidase/acylaminoacyl peptidase|nr:S9 family peptidase [Pseudomonadota bacterium]
MNARTVLFASALALWAAAVQAHPALTLRDFRALVRFGTPHFSPDGHRIAVRTIRADFVHDRWDATLRVLEVPGGKMHTLVRGMRELTEARWSPHGRSVAFIGKVDGQAAQVFEVPATGGTPRVLTDAPRGVEQFAFSPDGRTLAYVTPDPSPLSVHERQTHHDLFAIHDDDYLIHQPPVPSEIWLQPLPGGAARQLTHGPGSVLETPPPFGGGITVPSWSADGHWIVYTRQADADDADSDRTTIMAVNVASGAARRIGTHLSYEYAPRFAPQGAAVAYLYPHGPGPVSVMDLHVGSPGGASRDVSAALGRDFAADFAWLPNGKALLGMADQGIDSHLFLQPLRGPGRAVALGGLQALSVAVSSRGAIAVVADSTRRAPELYLLRSPRSAPLPLTHVNRSFDAYAYPRSVEVQWHAPDGQLNDGILTYPNDYAPGRRYPLVVFSHGGPEAASTGHFDADEIGPLRLLFAAEGYLVFEPNYRGSDNLGNAHEHAIYRDPGVGPDSDVISGIKMLQARGIVDNARIAAVGHSYGGYMTTWLIGHQHFWRCAVVADGVTDWTEEYELSGDGNLAWTRDSLGGSPWDPHAAALYRSGSPITYAGDITTPTLILSGTADVTVPITESLALYHALASRHVPVKFLGIPGAFHMPQDPVHRALFYRAMLRWVVHYLSH